MYQYVIITFRSRTQVLNFKKILSGAGVDSEIVSTPKEIAIGCGLSLKTDESNYKTAKQLYEIYRPVSFVGFFGVFNDGIKNRLTPL